MSEQKKLSLTRTTLKKLTVRTNLRTGLTNTCDCESDVTDACGGGGGDLQTNGCAPNTGVTTSRCTQNVFTNSCSFV